MCTSVNYFISFTLLKWSAADFFVAANSGTNVKSSLFGEPFFSKAMTEKRSLSGAFLAPIPKAESDGPDVDLLCDDAPVGVVVVGADDVKVLDVGVDLGQKCETFFAATDSAKISDWFKKIANNGIFLFSFFSNNFKKKKTINFSGIRTRIVFLEGHLAPVHHHGPQISARFWCKKILTYYYRAPNCKNTHELTQIVHQNYPQFTVSWVVKDAIKPSKSSEIYGDFSHEKRFFIFGPR